MVIIVVVEGAGDGASCVRCMVIIVVVEGAGDGASCVLLHNIYTAQVVVYIQYE